MKINFDDDDNVIELTSENEAEFYQLMAIASDRHTKGDVLENNMYQLTFGLS